MSDLLTTYSTNLEELLKQEPDEFWTAKDLVKWGMVCIRLYRNAKVSLRKDQRPVFQDYWKKIKENCVKALTKIDNLMSDALIRQEEYESFKERVSQSQLLDFYCAVTKVSYDENTIEAVTEDCAQNVEMPDESIQAIQDLLEQSFAW